MPLRAEILEQPEVLSRLLDSQEATVKEIASRVRKLNIDYVFLAARGTSDHAGLYAKYLWGAFNKLPVALATPSLFTLYEQPPSLRDSLVVAISQSGQSPDIVGVLAEGRRQGRPTLAITNALDSPLAQEADFVIDIQAGQEIAVAATKTYTASLMAIAMLSAALQGDPARWQSLSAVPGWTRQVLELEGSIERIAPRYRFMQQCVVLGRGYNYSTAFEWAIKLKELTYVMAEPYSSADFMHGPIAMVEQGFPVMAVAPGGMVFESMLDLLARLRSELVDMMVISDQPRALELAHSPLPLPAGIPEWLTPIVSIVPAQLLAYYLTRAKGFDTEAPRSIHKVTETE
jgi:glucosamine--fructose-6-phosphate aminotransferase (isomerizing)